MKIEKRNLDLKGMIKADYFEYNDFGSNPGVYMEIKYSELIDSKLYKDIIVKANRAFYSVNNSICSIRSTISFFKELNKLKKINKNNKEKERIEMEKLDNNDFIISFRSSELSNDISINELNLYGIDNEFYSLLNLLDIVDAKDNNNKLFSINDLKRAFYRSELCLAFSLENLKAVEDTIKVFGKLLYYSLDSLSREYIREV